MRSVAVLVGSVRQDSINRKFAHSVARLASDRLLFQFVEIGDLPLYNDDLWKNPPEPVLRLKRDVEAADAALFVTPEYNRSFSPAIKNAIDWGTRPWGKNSWAAKPAAILGASPGVLGTAPAQNALKGLISVCDMVLMGQPEIYFTYKPDLFNGSGDLVDERTRDVLNTWIDRFTKWIERTCVPLHRGVPRYPPA
jgi:chromate reductase